MCCQLGHSNPRSGLQAVANGNVKIVPERFEKVYNHWLENIRDWCISRQLWWGHRIPVWYCFKDDSAASSSDGTSPDLVVARNQAEALQKAKDR
jgi:valyl-tRNA synthetase